MHGFIARLSAVVGVSALLLTLVAIAPAQAASAAVPDSQRSTTSASAVSDTTRKLTKSDRLLLQQMLQRGGSHVWEGGCQDMTGRCVFFDRQAQVWLVGGSLAFVGTLLCGTIPVIGCAVAAVLAYAAYEFISGRGGICGGPSPTGPYYKPNLEVRYTWTHAAKCAW